MKLERTYRGIRFSAEVLEEAVRMWTELGGEPSSAGPLFVVKRGDDRWSLDSEEEFFGEYRKGFDYAWLKLYGKPSYSISTGAERVEVEVESESRSLIQRLVQVFDRHVAESRIPQPPPPPPLVFIGHGHDQAWRDLKEHLQDHHGYEVETYESGARAGHTIRDVLASLSRRATFAILVMTGEDEQAEGAERARQNVVHEVGLFQGTLGWDRAIVATEDGVESFSNLQGINQLRFSRGNIREIFGDVLATLRREFKT
jgi:predicted nucleotide-binding protein